MPIVLGGVQVNFKKNSKHLERQCKKCFSQLVFASLHSSLARHVRGHSWLKPLVASDMSRQGLVRSKHMLRNAYFHYIHLVYIGMRLVLVALERAM